MYISAKKMVNQTVKRISHILQKEPGNLSKDVGWIFGKGHVYSSRFSTRLRRANRDEWSRGGRVNDLRGIGICGIPERTMRMTECSLPRLSSSLPCNTMNERVCLSVSFFVSTPVAKVTGSPGKINLLLRLRPRTPGTRDPWIPSSLFTRSSSTFYDSDNCSPSNSFHSMKTSPCKTVIPISLQYRQSVRNCIIKAVGLWSIKFWISPAIISDLWKKSRNENFA